VRVMWRGGIALAWLGAALMWIGWMVGFDPARYAMVLVIVGIPAMMIGYFGEERKASS